jgi:hypothetical protein
LVLLFSNNILTCLSFIFFQIRFLIKIDKKAGKGYAGGDSCVIEKIRTIKIIRRTPYGRTGKESDKASCRTEGDMDRTRFLTNHGKVT